MSSANYHQQQVDLGMLSRILTQEVEMRFQDPKIEKHGLHWRIRPFVPVITKEGKIDRQRKSIILGYCHEMTASLDAAMKGGAK